MISMETQKAMIEFFKRTSLLKILENKGIIKVQCQIVLVEPKTNGKRV